MKRTINQRIREAAKSKVVVRISERVRASGGFDVVFPSVTPARDGLFVVGPDCINVPTKAEALSLLLVKARCFEKLEFSIKPVNKKQASLPWCVACKKAHEKPTSAEHHEALKCRAKWEGV